jgi:hypothetical protein
VVLVFILAAAAADCNSADTNSLSGAMSESESHPANRHIENRNKIIAMFFMTSPFLS